MRFSIGEFDVVIGLKCVDNFKKKKIGKFLKNKLVDKVFNGSSKVNRSDIEDRFLSTNFDCDEDALKLVILYFVSNFLFSSSKNKFVDKEVFDIVDARLYNEYT